MTKISIPKTTLSFLRDLQQNNNREWFKANKAHYLRAYDSMISFAENLMSELSKHDNIVLKSGKQSLFRIYRDIRFSKDKTPYKNSFAGGFKRATKQLRGGYYFHIQPGGKSVIAGGFWGPNSDDLRRIRKAISINASPLESIISSRTFQDTFGQLLGDGVKTAPKGYSKDHPAIDLLRKKQFIVKRGFDDGQVVSGNFLEEAVKTFVHMRPFFNYMSEILTTDENGVPLYPD